MVISKQKRHLKNLIKLKANQKRHKFVSQNCEIEQDCKYFDDSDLSEPDSSDSDTSDGSDSKTDDNSEYGSDNELDPISLNDSANAEDIHEPNQMSKLKWRSGAGKFLRGSYGKGSRTHGVSSSATGSHASSRSIQTFKKDCNPH